MTNAKRILSFLFFPMVLASPCFATTYYVRAVGGDNASTGTTFATAWATLQYALDYVSLAPGDEIRATGTFYLDTQLDNDVSSGDSTQAGGNIRLVGANASGEIDGTRAVIDGTSMTTGNLFNIGTIAAWEYRNIVFQNCASGSGTKMNTSVIHQFFDCRFTGNNDHGISGTASNYNAIYNCEIDNNVQYGLYQCYFWFMDSCSVHDNGNTGVYSSWIGTSSPGCFKNFLIYNNGGSGISLAFPYDAWHTIIENTTIYNNSSYGIYFVSASDVNTVCGFVNFKNIIVANNGNYGIYSPTTTLREKLVMDNIASYGNASGHCNWNGGVIPVTNNLVTTDPDFVSTTAGSEDFTPQNSDYAVETPYPSGGSTYAYIGAIQPQPSSGGGTAAERRRARLSAQEGSCDETHSFSFSHFVSGHARDGGLFGGFPRG